MEFEDITEKIIGCAYKVYNTMGYGFLESVYERCLLIELRKTDLKSEYQKPIIVNYEGEVSYPVDPVNPVKWRVS